MKGPGQDISLFFPFSLDTRLNGQFVGNGLTAFLCICSTSLSLPILNPYFSVSCNCCYVTLR